MDVVVWIGWALVALLGVLWSLVWFLVSGWVSTLLQVALFIAAIHVFKYGWRQAPAEMLRHTRTLGSFFWSWLRARDPKPHHAPTRAVVRIVRVKEFGDVNISTLLSLLMLSGLALLSRL